MVSYAIYIRTYLIYQKNFLTHSFTGQKIWDDKQTGERSMQPNITTFGNPNWLHRLGRKQIICNCCSLHSFTCLNMARYEIQVGWLLISMSITSLRRRKKKEKKKKKTSINKHHMPPFLLPLPCIDSKDYTTAAMFYQHPSSVAVDYNQQI